MKIRQAMLTNHATTRILLLREWSLLQGYVRMVHIFGLILYSFKTEQCFCLKFFGTSLTQSGNIKISIGVV